MVSDFQSEPIRAIGGRLKIRGHPGPPIGEFADGPGWRPTEGAELRREVPSEVPRLRLVVWGRKSPAGGGSPIGGTRSPAPPSAAVADGNRNWRRELEVTCSSSPLPPFSRLFRSSSAFPPMSCLKIRVAGPEFSNALLLAPRPFVSIGGLSTLRLLQTAEGTPLCRSPLFPPLLRFPHRRFPQFANRGRPVPHGSPLAPRPMGCRFGGPYLREIVSLRFGGAPQIVNLYGIGDPADVTGWEVGLVTPPLPTSSTAVTAMAASIAVLCHLQRPPQPPSTPLPTLREGIGGDHALPYVSRPPDGRDPGNSGVAWKQRGGRSRGSDGVEGLPSVHPAFLPTLPPSERGDVRRLAPAPWFSSAGPADPETCGGRLGAERELMSRLRSRGEPPLGLSRSCQAPLV